MKRLHVYKTPPFDYVVLRAVFLFKHQRSAARRVVSGLVFGLIISLFYRGLFLDLGHILALMIAFVVGLTAAGSMFRAVKAP